MKNNVSYLAEKFMSSGETMSYFLTSGVRFQEKKRNIIHKLFPCLIKLIFQTMRCFLCYMDSEVIPIF